MFAIYRKEVGGRRSDRYFKEYNKAKAEIAANVERMREVCGGVVTETIDCFNADKCLWVYEVRMRLANGETATHAIIDGFFEDN